MANFESWRGQVELWMEHSTEILSYLVGLPGNRTDPFVGRHFQAKELFTHPHSTLELNKNFARKLTFTPEGGVQDGEHAFFPDCHIFMNFRFITARG